MDDSTQPPEAPIYCESKRERLIWQNGWLAGQGDEILRQIEEKKKARLSIMAAVGAQEPQMLDLREDAEQIEEGNVR